MNDLSPTDAALEGFRITREQPVAVAIWAAAFFLWGALQQAVLIGSGLGPLMARLQASFGNLTPEAQQEISPVLLQHLPFFLGFTALGLVFSMVMTTAVLRAVLRPAESRFGFIRLSLDELRQAGLLALIVGAGMAYLFLIAIVTAVVGSIAASVGGAAALGLNLVLFAATLCALIYPVVRLSLAPAMTFADGRISLMRSWALTRGRFWPLFGAYLMAFALALVVFLLSFVIFNLAANLAGNAPPDPTSLRTYFTPLTWVALVFNGAISALVSAITVSPMAAAFRQVSGRVGAPPALSTGASPWEG
jgi:hypothetical protein